MAGMVQQSAHQEPQKKQRKERTMEVTKPQSAADESEGPEVVDLGCTTTMLVLGFKDGGEGHYIINVACGYHHYLLHTMRWDCCGQRRVSKNM